MDNITHHRLTPLDIPINKGNTLASFCFLELLCLHRLLKHASWYHHLLLEHWICKMTMIRLHVSQMVFPDRKGYAA